MSFKTILVHAEAAPACDRRIALALQVADLFGADVTGLGAEAFAPLWASGYAMADGALIEAVRERIAIDLPAAKQRFDAFTGGRAGTSWVACEDYPAKALALEARGADLIVSSRAPRGEGSTFVAKPAELIMDAGCPVLLAADGEAKFSGERVVVAWKDSRESRRALADALPFLMRAQAVTIVAVSGESSTIVDQRGLDEVVRRLARHGVNAAIHVTPKGKSAVSDVLEATAERHGADLIVLGAYGHSRLQEWALGGVTEDLIAASTKFVLLSH